jgi:hypothetical protein
MLKQRRWICVATRRRSARWSPVLGSATLPAGPVPSQHGAAVLAEDWAHDEFCTPPPFGSLPYAMYSPSISHVVPLLTVKMGKAPLVVSRPTPTLP